MELNGSDRPLLKWRRNCRSETRSNPPQVTAGMTVAATAHCGNWLQVTVPAPNRSAWQHLGPVSAWNHALAAAKGTFRSEPWHGCKNSGDIWDGMIASTHSRLGRLSGVCACRLECVLAIILQCVLAQPGVLRVHSRLTAVASRPRQISTQDSGMNCTHASGYVQRALPNGLVLLTPKPFPARRDPRGRPAHHARRTMVPRSD